MKILNLHTSPNGIFSKQNTPNGGLEKVIYDLHMLMETNGVDIISVCSPTDWCSSLENFKPINPSTSEVWRKNWKMFVSSLYALIENETPDLIIVHGTNKLLRIFNTWKMPVLFVDHQSEASINLLYHKDFYSKLVTENRKYGGKIFGVSAKSNMKKEKEIAKQKIASDFLFDGFIKFQYITDELERYSVSTHNGKAVTIGNAENIKNPHRIEQLRKKGLITDYNLITKLREDPKEKDLKYWEDNIHSKEEVLKRTLFNIDRKQTLDVLNESMLYVSTCAVESAGISTFEAVSMGVPTILWGKEDMHSSEMFAPLGKGWVWEYQTSEDIGKFIEYSKTADRKKIMDYVHKVNNKSSVFDDMIVKMQLVVDAKIPQETNPLYTFL